MAAEEYDLIVVGAGPAGLTAGLYGGRADLKTLVLDAGIPGGQLLQTEWVEDYPGFERIEARELAERMASHARRFGAEIRSEGVAGVMPGDGGFVVRSAEGKEYRARAVIVATGGRPRKLGVPGEERLQGRGVSYCAVCDGPFFRNLAVAVVGGGDSAIKEAALLSRYASKVYLIARRDRLGAQAIIRRQVERNPKVEILTQTVVEEIGGAQTVEWVRICDRSSGERRRLDLGGVFIYVGFEPRIEVFPPGIRTDPEGFVVTDRYLQTSISGLFVAGDIHAHPVRQITNAVGDATTAALAAYDYLERLAAGEAVPIPASQEAAFGWPGGTLGEEWGESAAD